MKLKATDSSDQTEKQVDESLNKKKMLQLIVCLALCLVVVVAIIMVMLWKPWQTNNNGRTISVAGSTTLQAVPNEYVFTPSYSFTNSNQQTALNALTTQSNQITAKLKSLGVPDTDISTNSSGSNNGSYTATSTTNNSYTYTLNLTVSVTGKTLAQNVQDYLLTTGPTGNVSPQAEFSQSLQKQLENEAREQAEANARDNAEQSAKNLGFTLGAVKSVEDYGFQGSNTSCTSGLCPLVLNSTASGTSNKLSIEPGENDLGYSVTVVYYIH